MVELEIMAFRHKVPLYQLPVFKILVVQLLVTICIAVVWLLAKGLNASFCGLLGGLIVLIPNSYLALKTFRYFGAQSAVAITLALWTGEIGKYILTAVLFVLVFLTIKPLDIMVLFTSYFLVLLTSSLGLILVRQSFKN